MDRLLERPFIEAAGPMDLKMPLLLQARAAEVTRFIIRGYGKAATGAVRGVYRPDCLATIGAQGKIFLLVIKKCLTDGAQRWKNKIKQQTEGAGRPHLKIPVHQLRRMGQEGYLDLILGTRSKGTPLIATWAEGKPVLDLLLAAGATIRNIGSSLEL
jgi:hypothetical protein